MINEVENNNSLTQMSDLEHDKNQLEMMRYRENRLSYMLGFLALACSILACFICLNSTNPGRPEIIVKVLLNIFILLGGFLCIEKAKSYSKNASIALVVMGGLCVGRIFWIPLQLLIYFPQYDANWNATKGTAGYDTKEKAARFLGETITGSYTSGTSVRWLTNNGVARAFMAIVLLGIAAAAFIASGVIGYIRSRRLTVYLESLNFEK